ncbi:MAG: hypothetical protein QOH57_4484 [Mycobacterium sp.]|jgi:hypothetical protein|nr:hypothetical protein [Mycobacterium sp.]
MVRAAFNPRFTIEHLVVEDDKAAIMWRNEGTGGPQAVTWHDVVAAHERVLGRQVELRHVPKGDALPGYPDFVSGFMTLLESYDSIIPMDALAHEFGIRQVSLDESVRRQIQAAAATA